MNLARRWIQAVTITGLLGLSSAPGQAQTTLEWGRYLVEVVAACGNCHSPVDANGNRNGPALSGGPALLYPVFRAYPPNITPAAKTGIGTWSEDQIVTALREGRILKGHVAQAANAGASLSFDVRR